MELALSLRVAIERNELCLFFQPIIGLGLEATLRFEVLPALASGSSRKPAAWPTLGNPRVIEPIGVSVNVSGLQFARPEFTESLDAALAQSGLTPSLLELERTESSVVSEIDESLVRLGAICRKGVTIAIDDFGTGFSSPTYLETLPIDALKIDRSFLPRK